MILTKKLDFIIYLFCLVHEINK